MQKTSEEFLKVVLTSDIPARLYKVLFAYSAVGGWKEGVAAFLPMERMDEWGINRKTLYRHCAELVELGIFEPAGLSQVGYKRYIIRLPHRTDCPTS